MHLGSHVGEGVARGRGVRGGIQERTSHNSEMCSMAAAFRIHVESTCDVHGGPRGCGQSEAPLQKPTGVHLVSCHRYENGMCQQRAAPPDACLSVSWQPVAYGTWQAI